MVFGFGYSEFATQCLTTTMRSRLRNCCINAHKGHRRRCASGLLRTTWHAAATLPYLSQRPRATVPIAKESLRQRISSRELNGRVCESVDPSSTVAFQSRTSNPPSHSSVGGANHVIRHTSKHPNWAHLHRKLPGTASTKRQRKRRTPPVPTGQEANHFSFYHPWGRKRCEEGPIPAPRE